MKNKLLTFLLIFTFIKSLAWIFITPIFQAPDEEIHYTMTHFVAETSKHPGKVQAKIISLETQAVAKIIRFNWQIIHPVWQEFPHDWQQQIKNIPHNFKSEFIDNQKARGGQKLPQLYYWLNWPIYTLFKSQHFLIRFYTLRLFSSFIGLLTVYFAYLTAKIFFKSKKFALIVASLVAFQPMTSVIFSSITYDSLAILISTIYLYFSLLYLNSKKSKFLYFSLIVSLLGILTKTQLIGLLMTWPFLIPKKHLKKLALFIPLILPIAFIKDYREVINQAFWLIFSGSFFKKLFLYLSQNLKIMYAQVFPWYWGVFGWLEKTMPLWIYTLLKILTAISFFGLIKNIRQIKKSGIFLILFSLIMAAVVLLNDFIIFTERGTIFGVQGRYFLPAITAHLILLIYGLIKLIPQKYHPQFTKSLIIFSLILNFIGLYSAYQYFGWVWH